MALVSTLVDPQVQRLVELSSNFGEDPVGQLLQGTSVPIPVEEKELYDSKIGLESAHIVFSSLWDMIGKISEDKQGLALSFLLREGSMFRGKSSKTLRRKPEQISGGWNPRTLSERTIDGYVISIGVWLRNCARLSSQRKAVGSTQSVFLRPIAQLSALPCFLQGLRKNDKSTNWFDSLTVAKPEELKNHNGKWIYGRFRLYGTEGEWFPHWIETSRERNDC